ncbi:MAG: DUF1893 domain-containing protein [Candidatus Methanomethylicia archaeon]
MRDIDIAKRLLKEGNLTLTIVKNGETLFESKSHGIIDLINAIDIFGDRLSKASIADKIIGRAAALLITYAKMSCAYAEIISISGLKTLIENNIHIEYDVMVPKILNRDGTDLCPFEKASQTIQNPCEAYEKFKSMIIVNLE